LLRLVELLLCTACLVLALGASLAVGALGNAPSILGLGFTPAGGLSGCHAIGIRVGGSTSACIWIASGSSPTIPAHGLTPRVLYAILRK